MAEKRRQTRAERLEEARRARRRRALWTRVFLVGVPVLLFAVVLAGYLIGRDDETAASFEESACAFDTRSDDDAGTGRNHVPNPRYEVDPPSGGDHTPQAAGPGIYEEAPADGPLVHAMEHGFVILWHRPDLDEAQLDELRSLQRANRAATLLVPRRSLEVPVAATAWHRRVLCERVDADALARFIEAYQDDAPESGFIRD